MSSAMQAAEARIRTGPDVRSGCCLARASVLAPSRVQDEARTSLIGAAWVVALDGVQDKQTGRLLLTARDRIKMNARFVGFPTAHSTIRKASKPALITVKK